jgi:hypothetical protein
MNTTPIDFAPRFELKFRLESAAAPLVKTWLDQVAVPDPRFPAGAVNSLYFDTPRLALYEEKVNSDHQKIKVRLRWYGAAGEVSEPAFLEVKEKWAAEVRKIRARTHFAKCVLTAGRGPGASFDPVATIARELNPRVPGWLSPIVVIRYQRLRYVDPRTGWRLALDTGIRSSWTHPALCAVTPGLDLSIAVLEVKGRGTRPRLPAHLVPHDGVEWLPDSFSKYGQVVSMLPIGLDA